MPALTEKDIDRLALDACEFIGWKSGATVAYDPAGFDRAERLQLAPGSLAIKDCPAQAEKCALPAQARFDGYPYPARIAGFQRRNIFGPDEIGTLISRAGIPWNDGLGNGLYESLRIDRKFGLKHVLEGPIYGIRLPFLEEDWPNFREAYQKEIERLVADLREVEAVYGAPLAESGDRLMVLWCQHYPLGLFAEAYFRQPAAVEADLMKQIGAPLPPVAPQTPVERARQAKFWRLVRARQSAVVEAQTAMLRQRMGADLKIAANPHELPPLDMAGQGRAYDYPAVAIRPLLVGDDVMLRHYIAFYTQLYHDLTGKAPMVSVRMNTSAASPRFVPGANLIRTWYDQAVRHGAGAFYFWTRDYPYSDAPGVYDGPIPGNPESAVIPLERWQAVLDTLGVLCTHRRFLPPEAEAAILIPEEAALLHRQEWRSLFSAFSAFCEMQTHAGFISDTAVAHQGVPERIRVLVAPALEFISPALRANLEQFTARGGRLVLADYSVWDENGQATQPLRGSITLEPNLFEVFPLGGAGDAQILAQLAQALDEQVELAQIDRQCWVFDVRVDNLPESEVSQLRPARADLRFAPWLYEHGSPWIVPYL